MPEREVPVPPGSEAVRCVVIEDDDGRPLEMVELDAAGNVLMRTVTDAHPSVQPNQ